LCADRPGLNEAGCIVDVGRLQVETGLSWSRFDDAGARADTYLIGDTNLRYGVGERTEVRLAFTAYGAVDERGAGSQGGFGDVTLGLRHNLVNPDGSGFSAAVQPSVTLPTGSGPFESEAWSAAVALPFGFELSPAVSFAATPQVALTPDADGAGRHLAFGSSAGLAFSLTDSVTLLTDFSLIRDEDPAGGTTEALAGAALAWQTLRDLQLDLGLAAGLNRNSPDFEIYAGAAVRF
jgi:hypothetical protein